MKATTKVYAFQDVKKIVTDSYENGTQLLVSTKRLGTVVGRVTYIGERWARLDVQCLTGDSETISPHVVNYTDVLIGVVQLTEV